MAIRSKKSAPSGTLIVLVVRLLPLLLVLAAGWKTDGLHKLQVVAQEKTTTWGDRLVEWLRSNGGFVHQALDLRVDPTLGDAQFPMGIYASHDIANGEVLEVIPRHCLLTSDTNDQDDWCSIVRRFVEEYELGRNNFIWTQYVLNHGTNHIPSTWPTPRKKLLQRIQGRYFPPHQMADKYSYKTDCAASNQDDMESVTPLHEAAYMLVRSPAWTDNFVPILDMFNHRNGPSTNADSSSIHTGDDITVVASCDIRKGEQLHISYNQCTDCEDLKNSYLTPHLFADFGLVEHYPKQWMFPIGRLGDPLIFRLEEEEEEEQQHHQQQLTTAQEEISNDTKRARKTLKLTWISKEPDMTEFNYLRGHWKRLKDLEQDLHQDLLKLPTVERYLVWEYYQALCSALQHAVWDTQLNEEALPANDANTDASAASTDVELYTRYYDALTDWSDPLEYDSFILVDEMGHAILHDEYILVDKVTSFYQPIQFFWNAKRQDMCMTLNEVLQTCYSFRSHYHEILIHYTARYLDDVKRVLYVGGGDSMILHEILKYPNLELVVGMELDHHVVRKAFQHFGTQPHWDNPKVQWWYGDAAKTLRLLPPSYFGTFDLVLLDLETGVLDMIEVLDDRTITDIALLLLAPHGILAKNECFVGPYREPFTDYQLELEYQDVPMLGTQSVVLASNGVDFVNKTPKDHGVETLILKPLDDNDLQDHFQYWYDYTKSTVDKKRLCATTKPSKRSSKSPDGLLMVLEAENASKLATESWDGLAKNLTASMLELGLTTKHFKSSLLTNDDEADGYSLHFFFQEGYISMQVWPPHKKYCAFDIMLWSQIDQHDAIAAKLLQLVGSNTSDEASSSYRIAAGGMIGVEVETVNLRGLQPSTPGLCDQHHSTSPAQVDDDQASNTLATDTDLSTENVKQVLQATMTLLQSKNPAVLVLCGVHNVGEECVALSALETMNRKMTIIPIFTCTRVLVVGDNHNDIQSIIECEREVLQTIVDKLDGSNQHQVSGVVVDDQADISVGQVLLKILSNGSNRRKLLAYHHIVVSTGGDEWHGVLLERFRTDLVVFDPAIRAHVGVSTRSTATATAATTAELHIFSAGDESFYTHLLEILSQIEQIVGLSTVLKRTKNGILNHLADFEASVVPNRTSYDTKLGRRQFLQQQPLARQTITQFELTPRKRRMQVGDRVWIARDSKWHAGKVMESLIGEVFRVAYDNTEEVETDVPRNWIRFMGMMDDEDIDPPSTVMVEQVLQEALDTLDTEVYRDIGDGFLVVCTSSEESAIVMWDGGKRLTMIFFSAFSTGDAGKLVEDRLLNNIPSLQLVTRDELPRGSDKVVNFPRNMKHRQYYDDDDDDDDDAEDDDDDDDDEEDGAEDMSDSSHYEL